MEKFCGLSTASFSLLFLASLLILVAKLASLDIWPTWECLPTNPLTRLFDFYATLDAGSVRVFTISFILANVILVWLVC